MNNHQKPAFHSLTLSKNQNSVNHPYLCKGLKITNSAKIEFLLITPIYAKVATNITNYDRIIQIFLINYLRFILSYKVGLNIVFKVKF